MMWLERTNIDGLMPLVDIPVLEYAEFYAQVCQKLGDQRCHVANYFAVAQGDRLVFYCLLLDDSTHKVLLASHHYPYYCEQELESIAAQHPMMHPFEREITENYGVRFNNSPWRKPVRRPLDYPFYSIAGESLHEVNVGPIHAGIIEPGAFRFICNGEKVLHLEIALGYQHRGVEKLMSGTDSILRQSVIAESIAGDSAVAHGTAYALLIERLAGAEVSSRLDMERVVALELERMAMHIADTGALCTDVGYQLGQVACEALRTIVINTTQLWCGNRFGKGLVRAHGSYYPLTGEIANSVIKNIKEVKHRYGQVRMNLKSTPSVLARFEECGVVTQTQMAQIGGVGMPARACGLVRDIRTTHPWSRCYKRLDHQPVVRDQGDVMARLMIRAREVEQSADYILKLLAESGLVKESVCVPDYATDLSGDSLVFSIVEGWRGEIVHIAITDTDGKIAAYKIKDPSFHNWTALALSVRDEGVSDFPICNKSFNLSYAGHDL